MLFSQAADPARALRWSLADLRRSLGRSDLLKGDPISLPVDPTLDIDVLRLESSETDDSSPDVAAGKYLGEDVYIGAKQGSEADSGTAEVEVELTPNISIESEVGQQGQSEVGVKFKWDY